MSKTKTRSPSERSVVPSVFRAVAHGSLVSAAWLSTTLHAAVNDLPGGPAVNQLNFAPAVTKIAEEQHWLHWFMMVICAVIFVVVFGVMFYSILKHRKSVGHKSQELAEPIWVELGWTIVPLLIVIGMALPATKVLVAQKDTTNADLTIKTTGMQWKWGYDYINGEGEGISFISTLDNAHRAMSDSGNPPPTDNYLLKVDNPMVVPVGKKSVSSPPQTTSFTLGWCPLLVSSKMRSLASFVTRGSKPKKWVITTGSAPSCAARSMPTCLST